MAANNFRVADLSTPTFDTIRVKNSRGHNLTDIPFQLDLNTTTNRTPNIAGLFHEALRIVFNHGQNPREPRSKLMESYRTVQMAFFPCGAPNDLFIWYLLDNR